ncbi:MULTISPECIES: dynamin family protein [Actinoalloteichus]|uniref:Dynamin family protein n=2 Tax=Actinoalloteichus cyanogriseus TaxID=2893586 RepID=A0ABT1JKL7_ACTCY|nr:dynamin family protein [Actinoalloteichus caeruleus]MCP2333053.1 Dynamin family protein [Actinoalloteichus caeruleus DSM 43889]
MTGERAPSGSGVALPKLVRQTRERLVELLRSADVDAAEWVERVRGAKQPRPTVVVVGETNRGKSSLVNALLDQHDLSPVDADVATATYLRFTGGPSWSASARYGDDAAVDIPLGELRNWVCVDGTLPPGALPPRDIAVTGPAPLLTDLDLVDTPGVGGLDAIHGERAADAAAKATALLFVLDASSPLTHGELSFLRSISDRVETVVFALTKTDQYRGWREVLAADRALLAEHAPRFADADIHPVSARLSQLAASAPHAGPADMLRARSGIAELATSLVSTVAGRGNMLGEANTMRALASSLAALTARLEAEERALTTGEDEARALRRRRDELSAERRSASRGWQLRLRGELNRARVECGHEVARQVRDVQYWFRRQIDGADRAGLERLPRHVDAALRLLSARTSAMLEQRLARVTELTLAELFSPAELAMIRDQVARSTQPFVVMRPADRRQQTAEDRLLVFMGGSMGISAGLGASKLAMLPFGAAAGLAALPLVVPVVALGLGAGWWIGRVRRHGADKQHLRQWLSDALADARSTLDQVVSEQLIEAEIQLSTALDEVLGRRVNGIEEELREVDRALRMGSADRARETQRVRRTLAEVRAGAEQVDQLLARMRELGPGRGHAAQPGTSPGRPGPGPRLGGNQNCLP